MSACLWCADISNQPNIRKSNMTKRLKQMAGVAALSVAASSLAFADIKLNDNFSVGGYAVGEANYNESKPVVGDNSSTSKLDGDAYKLWSSVTFAPVTGTISIYAGQSGEPVILDAYATYDMGGGTKVSVGKFLSWLGYEAYDPINMTQLTYAWQTPQGFGVANIPGYHSGVKIENGNDTYTVGAAVLDSVDPSPSAKYVSRGDGDLKNGPGFEAYYTYKGVKDLTLFVGGTYENNTNKTLSVATFDPTTLTYTPAVTGDVTTYSVDFWAQYVIGDTTLAGEYSYRLDDYKSESITGFSAHKIGSSFALAEVQQALNKQWSLTARVSWIGTHDDASGVSNPSATTFTLAPTFTLNDHLSFVAEYSYTKYHDYSLDSGNFIALQARFKF